MFSLYLPSKYSAQTISQHYFFKNNRRALMQNPMWMNLSALKKLSKFFPNPYNNVDFSALELIELLFIPVQLPICRKPLKFKSNFSTQLSNWLCDSLVAASIYETRQNNMKFALMFTRTLSTNVYCLTSDHSISYCQWLKNMFPILAPSR